LEIFFAHENCALTRTRIHGATKNEREHDIAFRIRHTTCRGVTTRSSTNADAFLRLPAVAVDVRLAASGAQRARTRSLMTITKPIILSILLSSTIMCSVALAEEAPPAVEKPAEPANSINVSPLGVLVGNYAVTYERLFGGQHGLIVEGIATIGSNDDGDYSQFGGGVGYRWHWRGRQNSGFLGIMIAQSFGSGEVTISSGGAEMSHGMSVRSTTVTGNVGKRWMFGPVNLTVRLGLGYGHHVAKAKEDTQEAKNAEELMNDILAFLPIGIDGELSVGYTF
jgi:hypothetical protein